MNDAIVTGLWHRNPELEISRVREEGLDGATDDEILTWAAQHEYIVVSHDVSTMTAFAYARVRRGDKMSGLVIVPNDLSIGAAINDLHLITECSLPGEWDARVQFLPF